MLLDFLFADDAGSTRSCKWAFSTAKAFCLTISVKKKKKKAYIQAKTFTNPKEKPNIT